MSFLRNVRETSSCTRAMGANFLKRNWRCELCSLSIGASPSTNWLTKETHVSIAEHNVLRKALQGPLPILNEDAEVEPVKAALDAYGFDFFFAFDDHLQIQQGPGESLAPLDLLQ